MLPHASQCRYLATLAERLFSDLDDRHLALEPHPGLKTAGWLIGHLAVTGDFARKLCGARSVCPPEWRPLFNPGSTPSTDRAIYPSMDALRDAFRTVYGDLIEIASAIDATKLDVENPFEPARKAFPTSRVFVEYMLTGHIGFHLGQLSTWRIASGLGARSVIVTAASGK